MGSAVLLLVACGGGGGSGLVEDDGSSNDDTERLRKAYDELQPGMTSADVIDLIGRPPDNNATTAMLWRAAGGSLDVQFLGGTRNGLRVVNAATWGSASESLSKSLL